MTSEAQIVLPFFAMLSVVSVLVGIGILALLVLNLISIKKVAVSHHVWLVGILVTRIGGEILITFTTIFDHNYAALILQVLLMLGVGTVVIWRIVAIVKAQSNASHQSQMANHEHSE